jgi:hypothetical protein
MLRIHCKVLLAHLSPIIVFIFNFLIVKCQDQRVCSCRQDYSIGSGSLIIFNGYNRRFNVNDERDYCDFECLEKCSNEIRDSVGGNASLITQEAHEKMCESVSLNKSLIKDGIKLWNIWELERCSIKGELNLESNICCRHCQCTFGYFETKTSSSNHLALFDLEKMIKLNDFSDAISDVFSNKRAYRCTEHDHDSECESECRKQVSNLLRYDKLEAKNVDYYDPLRNRSESDEICKILNKQINYPGVDLLVRIETGPRDISSHKEIRLGRICCKRICECELIFKNPTKNVIEKRKDLNEHLKPRPLSYYCDDELNECLEDCKRAVGEELRNEPVKLMENSVLDLEIFSNFTTARRACLEYNKTTVKNIGVNAYLKYSVGNDTQKRMYPFTQELFLGNFCCETYQNIALFPFNKCKEWKNGDIPGHFEDRFY